MIPPQIFIVDDDIEIANGLKSKILAMGYEVSGMEHNSKDALEKIPKSKSNVILGCTNKCRKRDKFAKNINYGQRTSG